MHRAQSIANFSGKIYIFTHLVLLLENSTMEGMIQDEAACLLEHEAQKGGRAWNQKLQYYTSQPVRISLKDTVHLCPK